MNGSLRIRSSKTSPTHSRSKLAILGLLTLSAALLLPAQAASVLHRWPLPGDPHGVAIGGDGTIYVGLAQPQAVVAIDPKSGAVKQRVVLDSAEIASTKELVTLRLNREKTQLYIANGSDESASILALPDLHVVREITMEGEPIRDILPDPAGRYLYILGRKVHVYDARGETELRALNVDDVTAIAASNSVLAVASGGEVISFDAATFAEKERAPVTTSPVGALRFASNGTLLAMTSEASQYGLSAYAVALDAKANTLAATDRAGFLIIYRLPPSLR